MTDQIEEEHLNEEERQRRLQMNKIREMGIDPFGSRFDRTHYSKQITDSFDELEGQAVRAAGRVTAKRDMGKASFLDLTDYEGKIQIYFKIDNVGEDSYKFLDLVSIGDFLGVEGKVFRTRRGEISIEVREYKFLGKALKPLPEKYHGLQDKELRYRQRYLDLIANPDVKDVFIKRTKILQQIRKYLDGRGFLEVETSNLHKIAGGAAARPFETHLNALDMHLYIRISLELHLKRLMIGGIEKVYELGKVFRNEGMDRDHNPEFTMLELYEAFGDLESMMEITEGIFVTCAEAINGTLMCSYRDYEIDLKTPWPRRRFNDLMKEYADVDLEAESDVSVLINKAKELGYIPDDEDTSMLTRGMVIDIIFKNAVEPNLIQPVFVIDYPIELSPLAKKLPGKDDWVSRFEPFIAGHEMGNAFTELNDPIDQRERFEAQLKLKSMGDEEAHPMDEDFINAQMHGMPPAGGLGIGVDRLIMLITGQHSIRDVIFFPMMR